MGIPKINEKIFWNEYKGGTKEFLAILNFVFIFLEKYHSLKSINKEKTQNYISIFYGLWGHVGEGPV